MLMLNEKKNIYMKQQFLQGKKFYMYQEFFYIYIIILKTSNEVFLLIHKKIYSLLPYYLKFIPILKKFLPFSVMHPQ